MSLSLRWPLGLLIVALLTACNAPDTTAPAAATSATPAQAPAAPAAPQAPATADAPYALTMDNVEAYFEAQKQLALAAQQDPAMEDLSMNVSQEDGLQYAARLEANAKVRDVIQKAGLSTRDFALTGETLMAALMAQGALEAGQLKAIPEGIDPASVEFVKQHKAEIEGLMKRIAG